VDTSARGSFAPVDEARTVGLLLYAGRGSPTLSRLVVERSDCGPMRPGRARRDARPHGRERLRPRPPRPRALPPAAARRKRHGPARRAQGHRHASCTAGPRSTRPVLCTLFLNRVSATHPGSSRAAMQLLSVQGPPGTGKKLTHRLSRSWTLLPGGWLRIWDYVSRGCQTCIVLPRTCWLTNLWRASGHAAVRRPSHPDTLSHATSTRACWRCRSCAWIRRAPPRMGADDTQAASRAAGECSQS